MNQKPSKEYARRRLVAELSNRPEAALLDLGCGRASVGEALLAELPGLRYLGIEPDPASAAEASAALEGWPGARVVQDLVPPRPGTIPTGFDAVVSLSVLEHVKRLERFIAFSAAAVRPGGRVLHLYDLGHALTPSTRRERAHVLAAGAPLVWRVIPARRWTAYLSLRRVTTAMESAGLVIEEVTHHNVPDLVALLKQIPDDARGREALDRVIEVEIALGDHLRDAEPSLREPLLPSVAVWARRP